MLSLSARLVRCALISSVLFLCLSASASATPLDDANVVRSQAGLPLLTLANDSAATAVNERLVVDGSGGYNEGEYYCGCYVYDPAKYDEPDYEGTSATSLYKQAGGSRIIGFWSYWKAYGPVTNRSMWALLLDPRITQLQWTENNDSVSIAVFANTAAPMKATQLSRSGNFNLAGEEPLFALVPSLKSKVAVERKVSGKWTTEYTFLGAEETEAATGSGWIAGMNGAVLHNFAASAASAFESRYEPSATQSEVLLSNSTSYRVGASQIKTNPMPAKDLAAGFKYAKSISPKYRKVMGSFFAKTPRLVRDKIRVLDGMTTIKAHSGGGFSFTGYQTKTSERPYYMDFERWHLIGSGQLGRFIAVHELGHAFDYAGLSFGARQQFTKLFKKSSKWKKCFPGVSGPYSCVLEEEIFADQFSFYASGLRSQRDMYNVPPLASARAFQKILNAWWTPVPVAYGFKLDDNGLIKGGNPAPIEEMVSAAASSSPIAR
jgi:hypothetical protein